MNKYKKLGLVILIFVVALFFILAAVSLIRSNGSKNGSINLLVAPSGSRVKLDGRGVRGGVQKVKPGTHSITATKNGFAEQTKAITVAAKQTVFVGIILNSNTAATKNWYVDHPADNNLVQSINNQSFDQAGKNALQNNPLLAKLPYLGPGTHYRIDYGVPSASSKTGFPAIYIRYDSDSAKQDALGWIKSQGANVDKLDIIYISVAPDSLQ